MNFSILIPARFNSSRFKGKPLKKIHGKEMIIRVAEQCAKAVKKSKIFIVTDSKKIQKKASENNFNSIMSPKNIKTGTDRIAFAARKMKSKFFINVQGDEPLIQPNDIKKIIKAKKKYFNHVICGYADETDYSKIKDKNIIKAVTAQNGDLIYFSRSVIPGKKKSNHNNFKKQVCIYAFSKKQLQKFSKHKKSNLERIEDIELLRFIDLGTKIKLIKVSRSISVDIPKNLIEVEKYLSPRKK
ncbi:3-deoxy-manno-octulosonate cytidylyltransferase [Pelagibacterales bacterium SAG-MED28]|nr:3-deoxy-manno-octulosonate cytidylyltransferase [Pelagibacterales bacterium SAG-MED28]|tara:strand:- start:281 stop:1006 length:726 start_codon:yes stop_codon:yes gene_type:complete